MNKKVFLTNKYTLSFLILLACIVLDVVLHRGMSRVIIPASFTEQRQPASFSPCSQPLDNRKKHWVKAVNSINAARSLPPETGGVETDAYFDTSSNTFLVYHDSANLSELKLPELLASLRKGLPVWVDFKNLNPGNATLSLRELTRLRKNFGLESKMIIESSDAPSLAGFCDSGFFTAYYIPFFNPYRIDEKDLIKNIDSIAGKLSKHRMSALSGYYFQYPILKKFFPGYPVLTWTDNSNISLVSSFFNRYLEGEQAIKVVLYPQR